MIQLLSGNNAATIWVLHIKDATSCCQQRLRWGATTILIRGNNNPEKMQWQPRWESKKKCKKIRIWFDGIQCPWWMQVKHYPKKWGGALGSSTPKWSTSSCWCLARVTLRRPSRWFNWPRRRVEAPAQPDGDGWSRAGWIGPGFPAKEGVMEPKEGEITANGLKSFKSQVCIGVGD